MNEQQEADVRVFIDNMRIRLENNEWKDGWEECETSFLLEQFRNKVHSINQICDASIIQSLDKYPDIKTATIALQKILADAANYAMMISGNIGRSLK